MFHLTALRRERIALLCAAACVGLNVGLDLLLIPMAGAPGAAYATLAAEGLMAVSLLTLSLRTLAKITVPARMAEREVAPIAHA